MSESAVQPCVYPGCRDAQGDPRLTRDTICPSCRRHYRRLLDWIVLDYVTLKSTMPRPAAPTTGGDRAPAKSKSFGHPAEWASDTAAEIASALNWTEDHLRDDAGHEPPPHPGVGEARRVRHAYAYLTSPAQFERLCTFTAAGDSAAELADLHRKVRRALGYTRVVQLLPTLCPFCDTAALVRDVGNIECRACGKVIEERHYDWLAAWVIDQLIQAHDEKARAAI